VLADILHELADSRIRYVDHHTKDGEAMFKSACQLKLEGIVSKRIDTKYLSGRVGQWTKTKCRPRQELVIGGWEMNGTQFSSLLLGAYRGGKFHYVGTAGTGFNSQNLPPLLDKLRKLIIQKSPFDVNSPKPASTRHFVKKKIVCEVAFETWTRSGKIRQASFKGLREDKDQAEVIIEEVVHED
jgi:bifunctional non-homologous end joining protein LigD